MSTINTGMLDDIRKMLEVATKQIKSKYDLAVSIGTIRYDSSGFRVRVEGHLTNNDSVKRVGNGLPEIGTKFQIRSKRFEVTDHKPDRPKFPIIVNSFPDNRRYKISIEQFEGAVKGW